MKPHAIGLILPLSVGLLLGFDRSGSGEALSDDEPAAEAARAAKMTVEELKNWSILVGEGTTNPAKLGQEPVLRYTNPGAGRVYGSVYLFTADGRPEAVLAIYKWFTPYTGFEAEMQSLSTSRLRGHRDGKEAWRPERAGLEMKDVPDGPTPAASAVDRSAQMRSIAGGFAGRLLDRRVKATGEDQSLRLLPKPLYRYESRDPTLLDGGLFGFVVGTDPEFFLLLEARETSRGLRWQYGLARMNSDPIQVTYKGKDVWKVDKLADRYDPRGSYFSMELPQGSVNR
jgi:hypothetical protein